MCALKANFFLANRTTHRKHAILGYWGAGEMAQLPGQSKKFSTITRGVIGAAMLMALSALNASAGVTSYTYDALGRVRQVTFADGSSVTYQYDAAGNRLQVNKAVTTPPTVGNVSMSTPKNTAGTVTLTPSGNWSSLSVVTQSANGTATISGTTATFTPTTNYTGTTSFTYRATGPGGNSAPGTVTVTVTAAPANSPPTCTNGTLTITGVPAPPNGTNTITVTQTASQFTARCTDSDGGTLSLVTPTTLSWTINRGQSVNVPFTVSDGQGGTGSATLTISFP